MKGDATLFAREDMVEDEWRIIDPILQAPGPAYEYEPGSWGPDEANRVIVPSGTWHAPVIDSAKGDSPA
jgi:glucose-6-phosphate 1-dehydrogenase